MKEPCDNSSIGIHWHQQVCLLILFVLFSWLFSKQITTIRSGLSSDPNPNRHNFLITLSVFEPIKHYLVSHHIFEVGFLTEQPCDAACRASSQFILAPVLLHIDRSTLPYVIAPTQQADQLLLNNQLEVTIIAGDYTLYTHNERL